MMTTTMTPGTSSEDAELVSASVAGNREAFGLIVSRYQSLVCSLAYSATGSLNQSEDLAQETFLAAWRQLGELREPEKLRAWICGIARNLIKNFLRTQQREPSHRAESLESIEEPQSPVPLPLAHVINQEEAAILWRSLERMPENYRVPLILFYREHQSIEAVAQNLELSEEAVRQRLSRGRKLLQAEVMAFVEVALERTSPGTRFTVAVVAALPLAVSTAKAASFGVAAAKGGAAVKSLLSVAALGSLMSLIGSVAFSWKNAVDEARSPRERKFMLRMGGYQVAIVPATLAVCVFVLPKLGNHPLVFCLTAILLFVANFACAAIMVPYISRRHVEIILEDGTWVRSIPGGPEELSEPETVRKAIKLTIPVGIMMAGGALGLPWRQHWLICVAILVVEALFIFWQFRMLLRQLSGHVRSKGASKQKTFGMLALFLCGTILYALVWKYLVPFYTYPEPPNVPPTAWLELGIFFLLTVLAFCAVAHAERPWQTKTIPKWKWLAGKLDIPFVDPMQPPPPEVLIETPYAPLFEQLKLDRDHETQFKELLVKRMLVSVQAGAAFVQQKLAPEKCAALAREFKTKADRHYDEIGNFLGPENFAVFQRFEKSLYDRNLINLLDSDPTKNAEVLSVEQKTSLLEALNEARSRYPWTTELGRRGHSTDELSLMYNKDHLAVFEKEEEDFEQQFLTQAQQILNQAQLVAFKTIQERQRKAQLEQLKVCAKLFGPTGL